MVIKCQDGTKRFVKDAQGNLIDREMHPKVKKAQEQHAKTGQGRKRATNK